MATSSDEIGRSARSKLSTIRSRGHVNIIHDASKVQYRVLLGVVPADQSGELIPKRCYQRDWLKFRFEESPNCEKPIGYKVGLSKTSTSNLRFDAGFDVHTQLQALTNRCPYYPDSLHDYPFVRRVFILFQALCCAVTKVLNQKFCESWLDHFLQFLRPGMPQSVPSPADPLWPCYLLHSCEVFFAHDERKCRINPLDLNAHLHETLISKNTKYKATCCT